MAMLYVDEYGSSLHATGDRVYIEKDGKELSSVRVNELELVIVYVNSSITSAAMELLMRKGIDVSFIQGSDYIGRLEGVDTKNISLRRHQYRLADDDNYCLQFARNVVAGKLQNMRTMVMRYTRAGIDENDEYAVCIADILKNIDECGSMDELRGLEGSGSAAYFAALQKIIKPPFTFTNRNRRPPQDPVNAMLGFSYAMLMTAVEKSISSVGMDAYCGFYHQEVYGRMSLALDLMEEWRPVLADSVVVNCCNRNILDVNDDFEERDGGIFMNESGRKKFVTQFHTRMREEVISENVTSPTQYYHHCVNQARMLAKCINQETPQYDPFRIR